ncbi:Hypothetical predicted protein [Pelobates cultripes]|uniref:Uncharacterized protein n=1 Tax=Pelobates cultripes TaxID=61616 RepID=A0AAD1SXN0_PELCU|nr:Hypothetical predicted protein [Pelobates cultripes]
MRRKSQKPATAQRKNNQDISQMLASTSRARGITPPWPMTTREPPTEETSKEVATALPRAEALVTKQDIHDLLEHFQYMFAAELNMVKTEVQAMIDRLQAIEEYVHEVKQGMTTQSMQQLQKLHSQFAIRMEALEDKG